MKPLVISCGDHQGIGPEVALKAVEAELGVPGHPGFVLVGDRDELERLRSLLGVGVSLVEYGTDGKHGETEVGSVRVLDPFRSGPNAEALRAGSGKGAGVAALEYLTCAADGCLRGDFSGLITAPLSKESILRTGMSFVGQTEYLAERSGGGDVTMMLLGDDAAGRWLRVALVTTHLPLRDVADAITQSGVQRAIRQAAEACSALRLPRARVAVCGLNPHAGEGGMLGTEEKIVIGPAVEASRRSGFDVVGPIAGDTAFYMAARGDFDAVVAMYHDQGLAPLKLLAFDRGVNWSLGLPFVRTSPDHGTAYDIAGRGIADPSSMRAALQLALRLARARARTGEE